MAGRERPRGAAERESVAAAAAGGAPRTRGRGEERGRGGCASRVCGRRVRGFYSLARSLARREGTWGELRGVRGDGLVSSDQ